MPCLGHTLSIIAVFIIPCGTLLQQVERFEIYTAFCGDKTSRYCWGGYVPFHWYFLALCVKRSFLHPITVSTSSRRMTTEIKPTCRMRTFRVSFSVLISDRVGCSGGFILNPSSVQQTGIVTPWWNDSFALCPNKELGIIFWYQALWDYFSV